MDIRRYPADKMAISSAYQPVQALPVRAILSDLYSLLLLLPLKSSQRTFFSNGHHKASSAILILILILTLTTPLCQASDPVFSPETITDAHGNIADADSNINWATLPENEPYKTSTKYNDGGLTPWYNFAKHFVSTVQPNEFPYGKRFM